MGGRRRAPGAEAPRHCPCSTSVALYVARQLLNPTAACLRAAEGELLGSHDGFKVPFLLRYAAFFACRETHQMLCWSGFFHAAEGQTFIYPS